MPLNSGRSRTASARNALSEQPVSRIVSWFSQLRTPFAMRLCSRFHAVSWRLAR